MAKRSTTADQKSDTSSAPAVRSAINILNYLASDNAEAGLSAIARATGINKSTCFNVLTALVDGQLIVKDAQRTTYRLGPRLIELGTASRRNFSGRSVYHQVLQPIVDRSGFGCALAQPLGDLSGLVVVDSVLPTDTTKSVVTPPIGMRFSITAPAMGRAVLAYLGDEEACDVIKTQKLEIPGGKVKFLAELALIRRHGYSTSHEEYRRGINAVSACILGRHGEVAAMACLVGRASELPQKLFPKLGQQLVKAARTIENMSSRPTE